MKDEIKKKKYHVYGMVSASVSLGEYEAESEEEAIQMAEDNQGANWYPSVCHQCSRELDVGDVYKVEADEVE